tara:strand:+ start:728 stop:2302 length:1575 start_codon:yes stop_codon:yes gene_type:complete
MRREAVLESLGLCALVLMGSSATLGLYLFGVQSWLFWVPLTAGGVLLLLTLVFGFSSFKKRLQGAPTLYWGVVIAQALLLLLVLGLVNFGAVQRHSYWDLTSRGVFSLAPQSLKVAQNLKSDISVKAFYGGQEPELPNIRELVLRYQQHTPYIHFESVDPNVDVASARRFNIQKDGARVLLVRRNEHGQEQVERLRWDLAAYDHEIHFTQALLRINKPENKTVYFSIGHGERSPDVMGPAGLGALKKALEAEGYRVARLSLSQEGPLPHPMAALLIMGPQLPLGQAERQKIESYLQEGGRLGLALEPGHESQWNGFLGRYGIQINQDLVIDQAQMGKMVGQGPTTAIALNYPSPHVITEDLRGAATVFPGASSISLNPGGEGETHILAQTGNRAWGDKNLLGESPSAGTLRYDPGEVQGPINLMVAAEKENMRLWVTSDADFLTDDVLNLSANKNLALNAFSWLANQETTIGVRPHHRGHHRIMLSLAQKERLAFALVYLWPLLCLFLGIITTQYRRYRSGVSP